MENAKLKLTFTLLIVFGLTSCQRFNKKETPNNWTTEDKEKVGGSTNIMIMMSQNPAMIENRTAICNCVINESIKKYPNIEDFKQHLDYSSEAFAFCLNKVDSLVNQ